MPSGSLSKFSRIDVLVLLRRVLRVGDRPIRQRGEPLGMLLDPGMVRGTLQGQVQGDLQAHVSRLGHKSPEVLEPAQPRVHRVVPTLARPDGPGRPHVVLLRHQGVVAPLPVDPADGVNGRQVDDVEAHPRDSGQPARRRGERAVFNRPPQPVDGRALGAREELIPGREQRPRAVDPHASGRRRGDEFPDRVVPQQVGQFERRVGPLAQGEVLVAQRRGRVEHLRRPLGGDGLGGEVEHMSPEREIVGEIPRPLAGVHLLHHGVAPRQVRVAEGLDGERPHAHLVRSDGGVPPVGAQIPRRHAGEGTLGAVGSGPHDVAAECVVPLAKRHRADGHDLADHRLRRVLAAAGQRCDLRDHESSGHRAIVPRDSKTDR